MSLQERLKKLNEAIEGAKERVRFFNSKGDSELAESWDLWLMQLEVTKNGVIQQMKQNVLN